MRWGGKNDAPLQDVLLLEQSNPFQCGLDSPKNGIYHTANYQNLLVPSMGQRKTASWRELLYPRLGRTGWNAMRLSSYIQLLNQIRQGRVTNKIRRGTEEE